MSLYQRTSPAQFLNTLPTIVSHYSLLSPATVTQPLLNWNDAHASVTIPEKVCHHQVPR